MRHVHVHVHLHVDVPTISAPPAPARQPRAGAAAGVILVFARTNYVFIVRIPYPMTRIKTRTMRNSERALTAVTVGVQCGICIFESAPCIRLFYAL